jgi:hypothetical protein
VVPFLAEAYTVAFYCILGLVAGKGGRMDLFQSKLAIVFEQVLGVDCHLGKKC